jgi:hypothetical protein
MQRRCNVSLRGTRIEEDFPDGRLPDAAARRECRAASALPAMNELIRLIDRQRSPRPVYFSRTELNQVLDLYSRQVAAGEWRDYAIDQRSGTAIFSVFRHSFDKPLYAIAKWTDAQGTPGYAVFAGPRRLKTAPTLEGALSVLAGRPRLVR